MYRRPGAAAGPLPEGSLYFAAVNAEFNWWLLIVGLVVGAGLVWYVVVDAKRREVDVDDAERPREAAWLAAAMVDEGYDVTPDTAERFLELHRRYLEAPSPDDPPKPGPEQGEAEVSPEPEIAGPAPAAPVSDLADDDRIGVERGAADLRE